jgi:hypothetical protein
MSCNFLVTARILSLRNMRVKTKMCNLKARAINQQYYGCFGCKYNRQLEFGQIRRGTAINRIDRILDFMPPIEALPGYTDMPATPCMQEVAPPSGREEIVKHSMPAANQITGYFSFMVTIPFL